MKRCITFILTLLISATAAVAAPSFVKVHEERLSLQDLRPVYEALDTVKPATLAPDFKVVAEFPLTGLVFKGNSWAREKVLERMRKAAAVYLQCGMLASRISLYEVDPKEIDPNDDLNTITDPFRNDQVLTIGRALHAGGLTARPLLIYVEQQTSSVFGVSFPSRPTSTDRHSARRRYIPYRDDDFSIIPYAYESRRDEYVPKYASADYLGEAHELGHLFGMSHKSNSPLMHSNPAEVMLGYIRLQTNEIHSGGCWTPQHSHLLLPKLDQPGRL